MPKNPVAISDILKYKLVSDPQFSPDGSSILFTLKHTSEKLKGVTNLWTVDLKGNQRAWTHGEGGAGHGRWSPDGSSIAFISGREKPAPQIFLVPTDGGEARPLTQLEEGSLAGFKWSPDGQSIAFLFRPTHPDRTEKARKAREESGASTPPWEIDDLWYRLDGDGYFGGQRHALYIVDVATGQTTKLYDRSPSGHMEFDWAPDSVRLVVSHPVDPNFLAQRTNDQLFLVNLEGDWYQLPGIPASSKGTLAWSPDGEHIAYLSSPNDETDWGTSNRRLYLVSAEGGAPRCLTESDDYCLSVMTLSDTRDAASDGLVKWSPDSKSIYVCVGWHGETQLGRVDVAKGGVKLVTKGQHCLGLSSLSTDGKSFAATRSTATTISDIVVIGTEKGDYQTLTAVNKEYLDSTHIVEPTEIWLDGEDGVKVHAWVMHPPTRKASKKGPAILQIHGGPHTQYGWAFFHEFQVLAAQGYTVVYSNPRGSKGYGQAFCEAIKGNWGDRDWADIQTVTRAMQYMPQVHSGQMGVMGGSYGGYMTNWAVGHTHDFKAAITDRCVSNIVSMSGNSDFPFNGDEYFGGCSYGSHERIRGLWQQSPIAYFEGVKTPMLIIHSEGDLRCNVEQGEQVFAALRLQNVEARFVRYPSNTSHGLSRSGPADLRMHRLNEIVRWWERHLKAKK